jgi:hypothetical protein
MAHPGTINEIRYLKRDTIKSEQQLQRGYYRELIHHYGVDATYFRHNVDAFQSVPLSAKNYDAVYGEQAYTAYWLSGSVIVLMESQGDVAILNKFGIETDGDFDAYILIDDFTEQFRDLVGTSTSDQFSTNLTADIFEGGNGLLSGTLSNTHLNGWTSAVLDFSSVGPFADSLIATSLESMISGVTSGSVSGTFSDTLVDTASATVYATLSAQNVVSGVLSGDITSGYTVSISGDYSEGFTRYPKLYHDQMYRPGAYTTRVVLGEVSGTYSGTLNSSLSGYLVGSATGTLGYYTEESRDGGGRDWLIAPKVGDFFRLDFYSNDDLEDNREEYEITQVVDRNLQVDGLNVHLSKYVWQMACVRRDPSHEDVIGAIGNLDDTLDGSGTNEEEFTRDLEEIHNDWIEEESNELFDYSEDIIDEYDGLNSDDVYGGYDLD